MHGKARMRLAVWSAVVVGAVAALVGTQPVQAAPAHDVIGGVTILPDHAYAKVAGKIHDLGKLENKAATQKAFADVQAKTYNGCPTRTDGPIYSGYICLYQDTNYNSGMWGASALDFGWPWLPTSTQSHCVNLQDRNYNTGGNVNNTAGSISVTADPRPGLAGPELQRQVWYWVLFDWVNCNWGSDYIFMNMNTTWSDQQLVWKRNQIGENYFWENPTSLRAVSTGVLQGH